MSEATAATQTHDLGKERAALPAVGRWELDPGHAEVAFVGRHFMLTKVRGRFVGVTGHVDVAEHPERSTASIEIDMSTVSSGSEARDDHLRSADFFDVENHPTATFDSTRVVWDGTNGRIEGLLTITDVARPVALDVEFIGQVTDPWGGRRAAFSARGRLDREDWGLTWNMLLDGGGVVVSKEIDIEIHAEFVLADDA